MPESGPSREILSHLPHAGNAKLPQRITHFEPGVKVTTERSLTAGDPALNDAGTFPAFLLVELMAQTGGLLIELRETTPAGYGVLAAIQRMHLHATARVGETVQVECSLTRRMGDLYRIDCRSRVGVKVLAHGSVHLRVMPGPGPAPASGSAR